MRHLYRIPKSLDDPMRIVGMPVDELVLIGLLSLPFLFAGMMVTAIIVGVTTWFSYKYILKKGQPPSFLINAIYWYLPSFISKPLLRSTPDSGQRLYIA